MHKSNPYTIIACDMTHTAVVMSRAFWAFAARLHVVWSWMAVLVTIDCVRHTQCHGH